MSLPRTAELENELRERLGSDESWWPRSLAEQAVEERITTVFVWLDRLIAHGYDHNFNCTNFNGEWINLIHAGRGPRLQLNNDGSLWVGSIGEHQVILPGDQEAFDRLLKSIPKPFFIQVAWQRVMSRWGGYTILFFLFMYLVVWGLQEIWHSLFK